MADPIEASVTVDPDELPEPRRVEFDHLVDKYGREPIEDTIRRTLDDNAEVYAGRIVNAVFNNQGQLRRVPMEDGQG